MPPFSCFRCYTSSLSKKCRLFLFRKDAHFPVVHIQPTKSCLCLFRMYWSRYTGRGPLRSIQAVNMVKLPSVVCVHYMYSEAGTAGSWSACACQHCLFRRSHSSRVACACMVGLKCPGYFGNPVHFLLHLFLFCCWFYCGLLLFFSFTQAQISQRKNMMNLGEVHSVFLMY